MQGSSSPGPGLVTTALEIQRKRVFKLCIRGCSCKNSAPLLCWLWTHWAGVTLWRNPGVRQLLRIIKALCVSCHEDLDVNHHDIAACQYKLLMSGVMLFEDLWSKHVCCVLQHYAEKSYCCDGITLRGTTAINQPHFAQWKQSLQEKGTQSVCILHGKGVLCCECSLTEKSMHIKHCL